MPQKALTGVKVLEYAQLVSGPYCSKLLADLGAEVIKIEEPGVGDEARRRGPFCDNLPHPEKSGLFFYLNSNKLGVTLNPYTATGKKIFKELARQSDVLIEDKTPKVMRELELDYQSLKEINPHLIVVSITPFGQTGPYRDYKAYPLNSYAGSGLAKILSDILPEDYPSPLKGWGYLGDYDCGLSAAIAAMGALYARLFTGKGQHVDVSKQESLMALERVEIGIYGNEKDEGSTVSIKQMIGGLHRCKDGYVVITIFTNNQWDALIKAMGNPEWARDEAYKKESYRVEHRDEINARIAEWVKDYNKKDIYYLAQAHSVPVGFVATVEDLLNSPQLKARGFFKEVEHPKIGRVKFPTAPYQFSVTPWSFERPAPLLGEHNEHVYCDRLGYSRQELAKMMATKVI